MTSPWLDVQRFPGRRHLAAVARHHAPLDRDEVLAVGDLGHEVQRRWAAWLGVARTDLLLAGSDAEAVRLVLQALLAPGDVLLLAEPVARQARVKTLFVPRRVEGFVSSENGRVRLENILIPVDKHPQPQAAVDAAMALATLLGSPRVHFTLLHVTPGGEMPELRTQDHPGWTWSRVFRDGEPVNEILACAESSNSDLVVMSTEGRRGFLDALRGSVTERVLRGLRCPLLAVPAN